MPSWTRNKKLTVTWSFFHFCLLSAGIVLIVVAEVWTSSGGKGVLNQHTLRGLVFSDTYANGAMRLGIVLLVASVVGFLGFFSGLGPGRGDLTAGLIIFNVTLLAAMIATLVVGTTIWYDTLTERDTFYRIWLDQLPETRAFIQDTKLCCGYWNATIAGSFDQANGFCDPTNNANLSNTTPCVTSITGYADFFLNAVFSTIYGFTAIELCLFLTTCCLITSRKEEERFRRIALKKGSRGGFV